ncbi:MAG TPA: RNA-binding protein [Methanomicrobia archaeon]|nr:RNA-binding protein [Methanomicrobia archaeon]
MILLEIKRRHDMSKSDVKKLFNSLDTAYDEIPVPPEKGRYMLCETDTDVSVVTFEGTPSFLLWKDQVIPSLHLFLDLDVRTLANRVIVDMGAISFVTNGADIMRPGIVDVSASITENMFVIVGDERHGKPLAIGIALYDGETIAAMSEGKAVKNVHYVGDPIWNLKV